MAPSGADDFQSVRSSDCRRLSGFSRRHRGTEKNSQACLADGATDFLRPRPLPPNLRNLRINQESVAEFAVHIGLKCEQAMDGTIRWGNGAQELGTHV